MAKAPAMQFYVRDWMADTAGLSTLAKGAWIQTVCRLHLADTRGRLTQTVAAWARLFGCSEKDAHACFSEWQHCEGAGVTICHNDVTLTSRRMERERIVKEDAAERKRKSRASQGKGENVTTPSASASAKQDSATVPDALQTPDFEAAWTDWLTYRKQSHKPLTDIGTKRVLNKLAVDGPGAAIARIHRSIENGWQGLFFKDEGTSPAQQAANRKRVGEIASAARRAPTKASEQRDTRAEFQSLPKPDQERFLRQAATELQGIYQRKPKLAEVLQRAVNIWMET